MGDAIVKQGNHNHPLVLTLKHTDPLTGIVGPYVIPDGSIARIKITVDGDTALVIDQVATILNQVNYPGKIQYLLQAAFTDDPDTYDVECKLTLPDGTVRHFPGNEDETFGTLRVLPSKGDL